MSVLLTGPVPALAPFVHSMGYFTGSFAHAREKALPTGTAQLLVNLADDRIGCDDGPAGATRGAVLQGPYARPSVIDPADQRRIVWVAFRLGGSRPFVAADTAELRDRLVDLDDLWGRGGGALLRERLLAAPTPRAALDAVQAVLLERAVRPLAADPAVTAAGRALHRGLPVAAVADGLGWTGRRLGRSFHAQVGLPPKSFSRVRRFQRLLARAAAGPGADWARLAAECGFHDQAHLINEFRAFADMTPTAYAPRSAGDRNHVPIPPIPAPAAGGTLVA